MQSQVKFKRVREKVPDKVPGSLGAKPSQAQRVPEKVPEKEPGQVQQGLEEGSGEGLGGFGAEPGQVQQGSGDKSGEGSRMLWRRARSGSTDPEKVWEALAQSQQVRLNRVPEKVPEKPWCRAKSSSTVSEKFAEAKRGQVHLTDGNLAEVFAALGFAVQYASERFVKIKCCGCWGYHRSLFSLI